MLVLFTLDVFFAEIRRNMIIQSGLASTYQETPLYFSDFTEESFSSEPMRCITNNWVKSVVV